MKYLLFFLYLFLLSSLSAQENLSLSGTISDATGPVYLFADSKYLPIELSEQGEYQMEVNVSQLPVVIRFGGISPKGQIEYRTPHIWLDQNTARLDLDLAAEPAAWSCSAPYAHQQLSEQIEKASGKEQLELISTHIQTPPARFFLYKNRLDYKSSEIEQALADIPDNKPDDRYLVLLSTHLTAKSKDKPKKGKTFPDFQVFNAQAQPENFRSQSDRPTVLAYMASGCGFSVNSVPRLAELQEQYKGRFRLVTVWDDRTLESFTSSPDQKSHISWENLWDKNGLLSPWLGGPATPSYYLINPEGKLEKVVVGTGKLRKALSKWL